MTKEYSTPPPWGNRWSSESNAKSHLCIAESRQRKAIASREGATKKRKTILALRFVEYLSILISFQMSENHL